MSHPESDPFIDLCLRSLPEADLPAQLRRQVAQIPIENPRGVIWPSFAMLRHSWAWALSGALGMSMGLTWPESETILSPMQLSESTLDASGEPVSLAALTDLAWSNDWAELLGTNNTGSDGENSQ